MKVNLLSFGSIEAQGSTEDGLKISKVVENKETHNKNKQQIIGHGGQKQKNKTCHTDKNNLTANPRVYICVNIDSIKYFIQHKYFLGLPSVFRCL